MGKSTLLKTYSPPKRPLLLELPAGLSRRRPRSYTEWKFLRRWGKLPVWELDPPGYLLRLARQEASLMQRELASRLSCSQQAVAQAERVNSNPTLDFIRKWVAACGGILRIRMGRAAPGGGRQRPAQARQRRRPAGGTATGRHGLRGPRQ